MAKPLNVQASGMGLSLTPGVLAALVVLGLATGSVSQSRAESSPSPAQSSRTATMSVTFPLDDFDDWFYNTGLGYNQPRRPNDFGADQGTWISNGAVITDSTSCSGPYSCYLALTFNLSAPGAEGGYWEKLKYSYTSTQDILTWPARDLTAFEEFRFRVRGDATYGFPDQFQIEFIGSDWNQRAVFTIANVTPNWEWRTIALSTAAFFDWSNVKQMSVKLVGGQMTNKTGRLFLDDFSLVDADFAGNLLDVIQRQTFMYFWDNRHPNTGFVRDRLVDPFYGRNVTSVAAVGFELAAFGIGAQRGWISRADAAAATHQVLDKLLALPQGPAVTGTSGYKGFFYHLLDIDTGLRTPDAEVSTIDSALLMAGVLFAKQYYTGPNPTEVEIRDKANRLYDRVDWDWMLRTEAAPSTTTNQFYMAWKPEYHNCQASGYQNCYEIPDTKSGAGYFSGEVITGPNPSIIPTTWDYYTDEILLINLLAIGSPTHNVLPNTFWAWTREQGTYAGYTLYQSKYGQLFAHLIGQVWLDMRGTEKNTDINWWQNSQQAVLANRQFAIDRASTCTTYLPPSWGLSTSLGPSYNPPASSMDGVGAYKGYGALPRKDLSPPLDDCTVAPYAAAGSIMFLSSNQANNEAYQALDDWFYNQPRLWGLYGFRDGFNLKEDWFAHDYIGIDQGMSLLAIENYRTGLIWYTLRREPAIANAMVHVLKISNSYLPLIMEK